MADILYGVCLVLALALGASGGFVWGRVFSRKHPISKKEMDALIDHARTEAYRYLAEHEFKNIGKKAIEIVDLANEIAKMARHAEESVSTTNAEPDPAHAVPPEMQSFEATKAEANSNPETPPP
jgi:hypothetical protein